MIIENAKEDTLKSHYTEQGRRQTATKTEMAIETLISRREGTTSYSDKMTSLMYIFAILRAL